MGFLLPLRRYKEVLDICFPLVLSTAVVTIMEFTDRVFLSNYSINAISAATPAGILAFLFIAFFSGVSGYGGVFIAQYNGAKAYHRIGATLWQTIYFSIFSAIAFYCIARFLSPIFSFAGHPPEVVDLEVDYFSILSYGGAVHVLECGFSGFFIGRGKTLPVMISNIAGVLINIPLDYAMINGLWGFPEMGIRGAAFATVFSWAFILSIYVVLVFFGNYDGTYHVRRSVKFDGELIFRLMKYGVPGSLQFCIDIFAFTFFIFMVGRLGKTELAITNILLAINSLSFMPAMGVSHGVGSMVGQAMGAGDPAEANRKVVASVHLIILYITMIVILYLMFPDELMKIFIPGGDISHDYEKVLSTGRNLLKIITVYVAFDALYMILSGALKGAGDTRFVMLSAGVLTILIMVAPIYSGIEFFGMGIYFSWTMVAFFVSSLFSITLLRYKSGKWKTMRVLEKDLISDEIMP